MCALGPDCLKTFKASLAVRIGTKIEAYFGSAELTKRCIRFHIAWVIARFSRFRLERVTR